MLLLQLPTLHIFQKTMHKSMNFLLLCRTWNSSSGLRNSSWGINCTHSYVKPARKEVKIARDVKKITSRLVSLLKGIPSKASACALVTLNPESHEQVKTKSFDLWFEKYISLRLRAQVRCWEQRNKNSTFLQGVWGFRAILGLADSLHHSIQILQSYQYSLHMPRIIISSNNNINIIKHCKLTTFSLHQSSLKCNIYPMNVDHENLNYQELSEITSHQFNEQVHFNNNLEKVITLKFLPLQMKLKPWYGETRKKLYLPNIRYTECFYTTIKRLGQRAKEGACLHYVVTVLSSPQLKLGTSFNDGAPEFHKHLLTRHHWTTTE